MEHLNILSVLTFLPAVGGLFILLFVREGEANTARGARETALFTTLFTFLFSIWLWYDFDPQASGYQFVEQYAWFDNLDITYYMGVDGISLFLILLTTFLMPLCILASWKAITFRIREYMIAFLLLESMVIGVFCALDAALFYVFFEAMLIPMYLIIGIWGGDKRIYAAFKFFLYTLLGSVLFLLALIYLYIQYGTLSIPELSMKAPTLLLENQKWLWLAFFAAFAVKIPMWPVHTWLPDAHVQAPTAGSVILAGILIKIGAYGFLRFSLPMLPDASMHYAPFVFALSVIAIIYTSLVALVQKDIKKLIAYSSVAHMGFVTIGIFSMTQQGIEGGIIQMLSHGLISGALFLCVGVVYDRMHTREIARYGGLVHRMPFYAVLFMFFIMASAGLPGTSGFVGEFMALLGVYKANSWVAALSATGLILGAAYALWLYRRVVFGELVRDDLKQITDVSRREVLTFIPLVLLVLWMGIYPKTFLTPLHGPVNALLEHSVQFAENKESTPVTTTVSHERTVVAVEKHMINSR